MVRLISSFFLIFLTAFSKSSPEVTWPDGTYGLPKAKTGCPRSEDVTWSEGWRRQTCEDVCKISAGSHMDAQVERINLTRRFCIKPTIGDLGQVWPKGAYCVYRSGGVCPVGMTNGSVYWDDKDSSNRNEYGGKLPDGKYDGDTKMEYCCQKTGEWYNAIELPVDRPFHLLPPNFLTTPKCQVVKWALSSLEYILYDTAGFSNEDKSSGDHVFIEKNGRKSSPKLYYCYYQGCRHHLNVSNGFIQSPVRSPDGYSQYQYCSWSITVHATHVILLNFTRLTSSKCGESFLKIYDGSNESAPVLATLWGSTMASRVRLMSSKNNVFMVLNAGNNKLEPENSLEFEVKYTTQQMPEKSNLNECDLGSSGTKWYIGVAAGIGGMVVGMILMYVILLLRRRRNGSEGANKPSIPRPKDGSDDGEDLSVYQELDQAKMDAGNHYQSLRMTVRSPTEKETTHGSETGYEELNKVRENRDDNHQSLNPV